MTFGNGIAELDALAEDARGRRREGQQREIAQDGARCLAALAVDLQTAIGEIGERGAFVGLELPVLVPGEGGNREAAPHVGVIERFLVRVDDLFRRGFVAERAIECLIADDLGRVGMRRLGYFRP
jgi:hypothetical protein